jgi:ribosomal 50S subunit-associated protein YjgA (DUF615 family)
MVRKGADPKGAADIMMKFAKFHVPELARSEVVGEGGGALKVIVQTLPDRDN